MSNKYHLLYLDKGIKEPTIECADKCPEAEGRRTIAEILSIIAEVNESLVFHSIDMDREEGAIEEAIKDIISKNAEDIFFILESSANEFGNVDITFDRSLIRNVHDVRTVYEGIMLHLKDISGIGT